MNGPQFRQTVEDATAAQLDRLGSEDLLYALTGGDLTPRNVLEIAADSEHSAHNTFSGWADTEDDVTARDAFADVAEQEAEHRRRVLDAMTDPYEPNDGGLMHTYLRGREGTVQRIAAGMVGRPLVSLGSHRRIVAFFDERGAESRADLFRDLETETDEVIETALSLLEARCETDDDWERARMAAEYVIQVAYDDYADALRELGRKPGAT